MYLLVYVDDIILVSSSVTAADRLISAMSGDFAVKDLGTLHYFLGLEVSHSAGGLTLTQQKYSQDLLCRAGMLQCKSATTPMSATDRLSALDGSPLSADDATEYRNIVGGLQYLTITRPDISYAVNRVCQFLHASRDTHWTAVKRVLRYVRPQPRMVCIFGRHPPVCFQLFLMPTGLAILMTGDPRGICGLVWSKFDRLECSQASYSVSQ